MTDTTTAWTPEARKIREAERAGARKAFDDAAKRLWMFPLDSGFVNRKVDELFPPPPPEYIYGREVPANSDYKYRRRSDGVWEMAGPSDTWRKCHYEDAELRALAAEVPLTDKECDAILGDETVCPLSPFLESIRVDARERVRATFVRVLRGEVK